MDFLSEAGFLWLDLHLMAWVIECHNADARLALWTVVQEKITAFNLMGPNCSSWGLPNRGTSMRNYMNFRGQQGYASVSAANEMISRSLVCRHII